MKNNFTSRQFVTGTQSRAAFTLIELAIVFGIASIVIAAIWVAAGSVWQNYKIERTTKQVIDVVNNVRSYYGPNSAFNAVPANVTSDADSHNLIPIEMRMNRAVAGGEINHALATVGGGSFRLQKMSNSVMRMQLWGLATDECAKLLMQFPVLMPEIGVVNYGTVAANTTVDAYNVTLPGNAAGLLPLSIATATAWCANSSKGNIVQIDFKLRN